MSAARGWWVALLASLLLAVPAALTAARLAGTPGCSLGLLAAVAAVRRTCVRAAAHWAIGSSWPVAAAVVVPTRAPAPVAQGARAATRPAPAALMATSV